MALCVVSKVSEKTYKNKAGKDVHYVNYYLKTDGGAMIAIRPTFPEKGGPALDAIATRL